MSVRLALRGIGPAIIRQYLVDLGGEETDAGSVVGDDWAATVRAGEPISIGAVRLGQTIVEFAGDEDTVARIVEALKAKAVRAGG